MRLFFCYVVPNMAKEPVEYNRKSTQNAIKIFSATLHGFDGLPIEVEVDATNGIHTFSIVGLPDKSVDEAKDRIGAAIKNCGLTPPHHTTKKIVVNLAPAHIKKEGSGFDLAIALGYLSVTNQIKLPDSDSVFIGELSLDGSVRPIRGVLPLVMSAKKAGFKKVFVPSKNIKEASLVSGINVYPVVHLKNLLFHLIGKYPISPALISSDSNFFESDSDVKDMENDIKYIKGNFLAKRALLIAACGGHNMLLYGPPGSGKSMLAKCLPGILPPLSYEESLDVTKIYSVAGKFLDDRLITSRPFRTPHHSASAVAIAGGGAIPRPGEISLSHHGVLFLDELPEYQRSVIEALRQPLEDGTISISRANSSITYPARFQLIAAMNPCPCGMSGVSDNTCTCSSQSIQKYQRKISGPLMDRIDMHVHVPYENIDLSNNSDMKDSSHSFRQLICEVRNIQKNRSNDHIAYYLNAHIPTSKLEQVCRMNDSANKMINSCLAKSIISRRGYGKIIKIARTIADIDKSESILEKHIAEALNFRSQIKIV